MAQPEKLLILLGSPHVGEHMKNACAAYPGYKVMVVTRSGDGCVAPPQVEITPLSAAVTRLGLQLPPDQCPQVVLVCNGDRPQTLVPLVQALSRGPERNGFPGNYRIIEVGVRGPGVIVESTSSGGWQT